MGRKKRMSSRNGETTRQRKLSATESLADFSSKTEFQNCSSTSNTVELEIKSKAKNKRSSKCKTVNLLNDIDFDQITVQSPSSSKNIVPPKKRTLKSHKPTVSQKKRICKSNIKVTRKRKADSTDSLTDFSSKTEFSNVLELENKTKDNKISPNCKTDDFKKELDFDEKSEQTVVQSSSSNKLTVPQKKRTPRSNIKAARKRKSIVINPLADFSSETKFHDGVSDAVEPENKAIDSNTKSSNCKTFNFDKNKQCTVQSFSSNKLTDSQKKVTCTSNTKTRERKTDSAKSLADLSSKSPDQITDKSLSSSKLTDQLLKSSSDLISNFSSIIDKVRNLQIHPSVHVYSITPEGEGLAAIDVTQNLSHLAYSFPHSHDIHVFARKSLSNRIARDDLRSTWVNFASAKNHLFKLGRSEKEISKCISSPQEYIFNHKDDVSGLRFSSDDNLLLSCSLDGSVKVISTTTYRILEHYSSCGQFTDIDVNTRTTQFATTTALSWNPFHVVNLYSFERKSPVTCFSGHENSLKCVRFHPNGLYIATAAADNCIKLWCVRQAKEVRNFKNDGISHPEKITFSPDGKYIASTHSGSVKIWDIASGRKLKCLETSISEPCNLNVCYNYTGSMLAAGGSDKQIHVWNITSDESSEMTPNYNLLKSEYLGKRIFSIKYVSNFFSCVTG